MSIEQLLSGNREAVIARISSTPPADLDAAIVGFSSNGWIGLFFAAQTLNPATHSGVFVALINRASSQAINTAVQHVSIKTKNCNALHAAAYIQDSEGFQALVNKIDTSLLKEIASRLDSTSMSPLHFAVYYNRCFEDLILLIIRMGPDSLRVAVNSMDTLDERIINWLNQRVPDSRSLSSPKEMGLMIELMRQESHISHPKRIIFPNANGSSRRFYKNLRYDWRHIKSTTDMQAPIYRGGSFLHWAIVNGDILVLAGLRELHINFAQCISAKYSPWQLALSNREIDLKVLIELIEGGANPNELWNGQSLLHIAVLNQWPPYVIPILFALGVDPHLKNEAGQTALVTLLDLGYVQTTDNTYRPRFSARVANLLLAKGLDVNTTDSNGCTWFQLAQFYNDQNTMKSLSAAYGERLVVTPAQPFKTWHPFSDTAFPLGLSVLSPTFRPPAFTHHSHTVSELAARHGIDLAKQELAPSVAKAAASSDERVNDTPSP